MTEDPYETSLIGSNNTIGHILDGDGNCPESVEKGFRRKTVSARPLRTGTGKIPTLCRRRDGLRALKAVRDAAEEPHSDLHNLIV